MPRRTLKQNYTKGGYGMFRNQAAALGASMLAGRIVQSSTGRRIANNLMKLKAKLARARTITKTITKKKPKLEFDNTRLNHTEKKRLSNLSKKRSTIGNALQLIKANTQYVMYKWNGVKSFDDNGYYWLSNKTVGTDRALPCYLFDITSCRNSGPSGTITALPFVQMYSDATGAIFTKLVSGLAADGVTTSTALQLETSSSGNSVGYHPHARDMLKWVSIKMNCWGTRSKSTKYLIQLVRFTEDNLVPTHDNETGISPGVNPERSAFFQSLLKPYVFNPVSTVSALQTKKMKVYKSEQFIIDSTSTTEVDSDPNVKVLRWFVNLNRICNYVERSDHLFTVGDFADQADFVAHTNNQQFSTQQDPRSRIYLMIRATNYALDAADDNNITPSFDLQIGMKHVNFN